MRDDKLTGHCNRKDHVGFVPRRLKAGEQPTAPKGKKRFDKRFLKEHSITHASGYDIDSDRQITALELKVRTVQREAQRAKAELVKEKDEREALETAC